MQRAELDYCLYFLIYCSVLGQILCRCPQYVNVHVLRIGAMEDIVCIMA
jgi:hypothetical protein